MADIFSDYLDYCGESEIPAFFSRWCMFSGIGALLGRQSFIQHGHSIIYPNMYCMLMGSPGTRKSSAIKLIRKLLSSAGYTTFAFEKTSKEKFLMDMEGGQSDAPDSLSPAAFLDQNLFGDVNDPKEVFIAADEFNDFIGMNNMEFISLLGSLWDYRGTYSHRLKTGKSVSVNEPTVSILGGNTPKGFSLAFPPDILSQGFFSRLILIHGEPNGKTIAFPNEPDLKHTEYIVDRLKEIKNASTGGLNLSTISRKLLESIYSKHRKGIEIDSRFETYYTRRFNHLLKLCLIRTVSKLRRTIQEEDVIECNTLLSFTEQLMPKALGEFGRSKNSDLVDRVLRVITNAEIGITINAIWKEVSTDFESISQLSEVMSVLKGAGKVTAFGAEGLFIPQIKPIEYSVDMNYIDWSYLTQEELNIGGVVLPSSPSVNVSSTNITSAQIIKLNLPGVY